LDTNLNPFKFVLKMKLNLLIFSKRINNPQNKMRCLISVHFMLIVVYVDAPIGGQFRRFVQ
jgi:hypothetical protein